MKFRAVSDETKINYLLWSVRKEIFRENKYLNTLEYDPAPFLDIVKRHIDNWDPIQLLEMDCPADEYDGETRTVTVYITKHLKDIDAISLSKTINRVFGDSFNLEFNKENESIEIATNIINSLRSSNLTPHFPTSIRIL
ncbi:hypothetical protein [Paenibacillus sedimenti]|uniref:Uncharacterized protein n=1 Tax=Paenibacillus sedimenti TaxID=2770274 RepID=A0A926KMG8_9BACL|nr:hypothetical protein [Paenibacillus sedimenti]MBD0378968.1 hypothetical protein [Paenibacillus sedimenti]